jgi:signal transduction histidine kinase
MQPHWYEKIIDTAHNALFVIDTDRNILFANAAAVALSGAPSREALIGTSYADAVVKGTILEADGSPAREEEFPSLFALQRGIETHNKQYEQIFEGHHYALSIDCTPLRNTDGVIEAAFVRFRNISVEKRQQDQLQFLLDTSGVNFVETDAAKQLIEKARLIVPRLADWCTVNVMNEKGKISRIAVVHRDPKKEALVTELAELSEAEMNADRGIRHVFKTGERLVYPNVTEAFLRAHNTSPKRLELARALAVCSSMILPIRTNGRVLGVLSLAFAESGRQYTDEDVDFLERFCARLSTVLENMQLYEEIKRRDKNKDDFLAALSHELRNPLAPIKSSLEWLRLANKAPEIQSELSIIEEQFNHLRELLDDLLDVTRYAQGKIHLEKCDADISALVLKVITNHQPLIKEKHVTLAWMLPKDALVVWGDPVRLEQAIANVLDNARKFTPPSGRIDVSLSSDDDTALLTITDTGRGIDSNELQRIFDLYFQGQGHAHHAHMGLGMGLSLVREIVALHGGAVQAESAGVGKGAKFTISLPVRT